MRIAVFSDTFPPQVNGVAHVVAQSAMRLAQRGHDVHVLTASQGSKRYLDTLTQGWYVVHNVYSFPSGVYPDLRFTMPLATNKLKLRGWRPDIVHTHTLFGVGLAAVRCAKRFEVPLIGTHHTFFDAYLKHVGMDSQITRSMSWKLTVAYYNKCDLVVCPSMSLAEELRENGLETPVRRLPNPIDTELFHPEPHPDESRETRLIYMGRLSYEKSLDQVLTAFKLVRREIPSATLTVIGDGPERQCLEEQAADLGISEFVRFTGLLRGQELAQTLRSGHLFITASKTENIPLSALEAMASGLPVAAVNSKGLPEIVHDGANGILVEPDQPEEMARRVVALLCDPETLHVRSRAARAYALDFAPDRVMDEWETTYRGAVAVPT
ncbi:MAG: glycosyltransferase [Capsulimonadaceae bacterium]